MRPKYKVTGCARFFLFLIIFLPIVYFGAAYLRGENGMQMLKDFYYGISGKGEVTDSKREEGTYKVKDLQKELDKAKDEIRALKQQLREKEDELRRVQTGE